VSIAAVNAGVTPSQITMVDAGPWGLIWQSIGDGSFDLDRFRQVLQTVPKEPWLIQAHMENLARQPAIGTDNPYVFLLLQASSFGGKALWIKDGRWRNTSFRSYWLPTATSNRRSPVNPMMPMPPELLRRVEKAVATMRGVRGIHGDLGQLPRPIASTVVYIDPPYKGTTAYGHEVDAMVQAKRLGGAWISEGQALSEKALLLSAGRAKGGISHERGAANEEWLSFVE
jgi:hypothetical protein